MSPIRFYAALRRLPGDTSVVETINETTGQWEDLNTPLPIRAGDTIIYPCRRGSSMWLQKLTVEQVTSEGIGGHNNLGRRINLTNLENVAVLHHAKL